MKKLFKLGFIALAVSLSVAACNSSKTSEGAADSDTTVVDSPAVDSTAMDSTGVDTTKADTAAKM